MPAARAAASMSAVTGTSTLRAIRENPQRAEYLGINVKLYQWSAFVAVGALTGLAGGLYALMEKYEELLRLNAAEMVHGAYGLDGNSVVILGDDGVLVFDANGTPAAAESVLADIRRMTSAPVRYLVLSHWHWDHWYGAEAYASEFPGVVIVAHERTRALMAGPAIAFNKPGLDTQLPGHIAEVEAELDLRAAVALLKG